MVQLGLCRGDGLNCGRYGNFRASSPTISRAECVTAGGWISSAPTQNQEQRFFRVMSREDNGIPALAAVCSGLPSDSPNCASRLPPPPFQATERVLPVKRRAAEAPSIPIKVFTGASREPGIKVANSEAQKRPSSKQRSSHGTVGGVGLRSPALKRTADCLPFCACKPNFK